MKFLHAADIHLDSPLRGLERYEGAPVEKIRLASRLALENLVALAIERKVDFVLLAGDTFDGDGKDWNTALFFINQMRRLAEADIPVLMISGNHDAVSKMTRSLPLPRNVTLLGTKKCDTVRLEEHEVAVHGQSFQNAALQLGAPDRAISFTVPTGNFGNVFAGLAAKRMGLDIDRLVIATNSNDILDRTLKTGSYTVTGVHATTSPSMDIQVSSNFERLVYLANNNDPAAVRNAMESLKQSGAFTLQAEALKSIRAEFDSGATSDAEAAKMMAKVLAETGELLDPHTAVGYAVAQKTSTASPMVTLATAHPAKFPDAVHAATKIRPNLPHRLSYLMNAKETFKVLPNSEAAVKDYILSHT